MTDSEEEIWASRERSVIRAKSGSAVPRINKEPQAKDATDKFMVQLPKLRKRIHSSLLKFKIERFLEQLNLIAWIRVTSSRLKNCTGQKNDMKLITNNLRLIIVLIQLKVNYENVLQLKMKEKFYWKKRR